MAGSNIAGLDSQTEPLGRQSEFVGKRKIVGARRKLGRSGIEVGPISLGCDAGVNGAQGLETSEALVRTALERGVSLLAATPADPSTHDILGKILRHVDRESLAIMSVDSTTGPQTDETETPAHWRARTLRFLDASLHALRTEYVDVFACPALPSGIEVRGVVASMNQLIAGQKIRNWGVVGWTPKQVESARSYARSSGAPTPVVALDTYHLLRRHADRTLLPYARQTKLGFAATDPLARGLLSGAETSERSERRTEVETLRRMAESIDATTSQLALAATTCVAGVTTAIVDAENLERLEEYLGALRIHLQSEHLLALARVFQTESNDANASTFEDRRKAPQRAKRAQ